MCKFMSVYPFTTCNICLTTGGSPVRLLAPAFLIDSRERSTVFFRFPPADDPADPVELITAVLFVGNKQLTPVEGNFESLLVLC